MKKQLLIITSIFVTSSALFLSSPQPAHAYSFGEAVDDIKDFFTSAKDLVLSPFVGEKKEIAIENTIDLVPGGDFNKNGQIDVGDVVRFTYTLTNTTDETYSFASLKTGVKKENIGRVHNLFGSTGVTNGDDEVVFANVRIAPQAQKVMSFDAEIRLLDKEVTIATESDFIGEDKKSIAKAKRKEIKAEKLSKDELNKRIEAGGIINNTKKK